MAVLTRGVTHVLRPNILELLIGLAVVVTFRWFSRCKRPRRSEVQLANPQGRGDLWIGGTVYLVDAIFHRCLVKPLNQPP
jgi:hypothetical protein